MKKKLVIVGSGFAAFSVLKHIDTRFYQVTILSPRNHFLFTPLLPSTTVGTIEFRSIIEPIRTARKETDYFQAEVKAILPEKNRVVCEGIDSQSFEVEYDYLVIAPGMINNTYGIPGVEKYAFFLKEIADARAIRQRIIDCLEKSCNPNLSAEERKKNLHFVVVGGGPTGVEFAAEMHDFLEEDLIKWYPHLAGLVQITLLEASHQILTQFDAELSEYALKNFKRQNITVKMGSPVKEVREGEIILSNGETISCGLVVWSTGIAATPLVKSLPFPKDKSSRILTDEYFKAGENIFAIGDCATIQGRSLAATAQVAQQEGKYVAHFLNAKARHKTYRKFYYKHMGMLAYIGSHKALADLPTIKGHGFSTWVFWRSAYVTKLLSLKNKILVLFDWFKKLIFGRDISRF